MKVIIGLLMIAGGIVLGLYVGLWVCLVGGFVDIINQLKSPGGVDAMSIALDILKIMFAGVIGLLSASVLIVPGFAMVAVKKNKQKKY